MAVKSFKGFYRVSRQPYADTFLDSKDLFEHFNIVQQIPNDGVEYEFGISFYKLQGTDAARLEIFEDAFVALNNNRELLDALSTTRNISPDDLQDMLLRLGYKDLSDNAEVSNEA